MQRTVRHLVLGASTGVTVFAIVVPIIHMVAELATAVGIDLGVWDNPVEVFVFLMTAAMFAVFPWGLWILLTDARKGGLFDEDRNAAEYLLAAIGVFLTLALLACTRLQPIYSQFRWYFSPFLLVCALFLIRWRWYRVWQFPKRIGVRGVLEHALGLRGDS